LARGSRGDQASSVPGTTIRKVATPVR
jgi:hypothetical protein